VIMRNSQGGCSGGNGGGGIGFVGGSGAVVLSNLIAYNSWGSWGGGIGLNGGGDTLIANNVLRNNTAPQQGGAIMMINTSAETIVQNLIVANSAAQGGGIYWSIPGGGLGLNLLNNTIADNPAPQGSGIWAGGFQSQVAISNNVIRGMAGQSAMYCDGTYDPTPPIVRVNDAVSQGAAGYAGTCGGSNGQKGNLSVDPLFAGGFDYHLQSGSPCVDAG